MKKTLIITLLVALVLGIFTACNGDIFADLIEEKKEEKRVITLKIVDDETYSFEDGKSTKEIEIPSDCTTWGDFQKKGYSITIKTSNNTYTLNLITDYYGYYVYFQKNDVGGFFLREGVKSGLPTVETDEEIAIGETYKLSISFAN
jgi:hypothetical protein